MNPELEKLIDFALADGVLTEKEKALLTRKAQEFGEDMDEFEMVLEAKLHLKQSGSNFAQNRSAKEGDLKKCPSCGAPFQSFATKCSDCGHEFRNIESANSVRKFFEMLNEIESNRGEDEANPLKSMGQMLSRTMSGDSIYAGGKIGRQKKELIKNFPIPNTKEDILEFLSIAVPRAQKKGFFQMLGPAGHENMEYNTMVPIWKTKCEQIIMKARLSMKDDKTTLAEIDRFAKQIGIK